MKPTASGQAEFDALDKEFREYVNKLKTDWLAKNPANVARDIFGVQKDVYEVMNQRDRDRVHAVIAQWGRYITPIAEAWWKERGYAVVWPDDDSKPVKYYKLKGAPNTQ